MGVDKNGRREMLNKGIAMLEFLNRGGARGRKKDINESVLPEVPDTDPNSPLSHNQRLFQRLNHDIETGKLPTMHKPSRRDMAKCEQRRREELERAQAAYDAEDTHEPWGAAYSLERIQANQHIPVEVELWVEAVCDRYLRSAKPMMGLVHWKQDVRKRLYETRGYEWYAITEIYPMITFD